MLREHEGDECKTLGFLGQAVDGVVELRQGTIFGEELLQILLGAGVGQVPYKEPSGLGQVLLLFVLPEHPALPGFGGILWRNIGGGDVLFPEHLDVAPAHVLPVAF